jgi:hypothetical protein
MDAGANLPSHLPLLVASLAFALAFVFGAVANRVSFCTMGPSSTSPLWGLETHAYVGTRYRCGHCRCWVLVATGLIDTAKTIYTAPQAGGCHASSGASFSASG